MNIRSLICLLFLPLLAGCAGYKSQPLKQLQTIPLVKHKDISFAAKAFKVDECQTYLGRNVINAGYTPIQITINNESKKQLQFSCDQMNMAVVPTNIVAQSVYQSFWARALGYGIPGAAIGASGAIYTAGGISAWIVFGGWDIWFLTAAAASILSGGLALLAVGLIDGGAANLANKQLRADYLNKTLTDQIILSHTSANGLVFVKNDELEKQLSVSLIDNVTHEKIVCQASL